MFRLKYIWFNHLDDRQEYKFSDNAFVYGKNTSGKTALTIVIDYILGSSDNWGYQGLENIDSVEALLTNENTKLWVKRITNSNHYLYKRTESSEYIEVSSDVYKKNIALIFSELSNNRYLEIYSKVFGEAPTFRAFNFLDFIEEKGLGDLSTVFTKAKDTKHNVRIRNIMNFFFNFDNIEQIFEKEVLLEEKSKELEELSINYKELQRSQNQLRILFNEIQLKYTGNYSSDYKLFCDFKNAFERKEEKNDDLIYLSQSSFSLAEEIKLHRFMKFQSKNMVERKERVGRLLALMNSVIDDNPAYAEYTEFIRDTIQQLDEENIILASTDYNKVIKKIEMEKNKIDQNIAKIKGKTTELSYEEALKKFGLLEHIFDIIKEDFDIGKKESLEKEVKALKKEIKELKNLYDQKKIEDFNKKLTKNYLENELNITHIKEDMNEENFSLEFDPFRLCLFAKHKVDEVNERYMPGSMARQTHIQMLVYLTMFDFLKENFPGFIYMPMLVIDSANQPMGVESFEQFYPVFTHMARTVGIQTIFLSKDKIDGIEKGDIIDISKGLNKFH